MLHKEFDVTLERLELFLSGKCYPEEYRVSIKSQLYFDKQ